MDFCLVQFWWCFKFIVHPMHAHTHARTQLTTAVIVSYLVEAFTFHLALSSQKSKKHQRHQQQQDGLTEDEEQAIQNGQKKNIKVVTLRRNLNYLVPKFLVIIKCFLLSCMFIYLSRVHLVALLTPTSILIISGSDNYRERVSIVIKDSDFFYPSQELEAARNMQQGGRRLSVSLALKNMRQNSFEAHFIPIGSSVSNCK